VCVLFLLFTGYYLCPIHPTTTTTTTLVWASNSPYQQQHLKSYYYYILNTTYPAGQDRRQQPFSQLFCKPLWCSQCSCFMKLSLIRYQSLKPEVIWPLWSIHGSTSWPTWWHWGPFCSSFVFLFCYYQLNLIVKLLSLNFSTIIWKKRSKRVLPTDFRFPFLSVYMRWNKEVFKFFFISQCSYHRTFSGSFCYYYYYYLLYCYVRLTLKQVEK